MTFRTTHQLGPQFDRHDSHFHWDPANVDVSYRLGNPEEGNDGHDYVLVQAGASLAAGARVNIDESTWVATANASGTHMVPSDIVGGPVPLNNFFHARRFTL